MADNTFVVLRRYPFTGFAAIADVVPSAKARKWLPPVSKKPASLVLA
jgi:hypothetical protein